MAGSSRSKGLMLVGLLVAAAAVVLLVAGNPFGPGAGAGSGDAAEGVAPEALGADAAGNRPDEIAAAGTALQGAFDVRGVGDVRVRLLLGKQRKPLPDQPVRLVSPKGEVVERSTGADGRVLLQGVRAARDWTLKIEGKGFTAVEMRPVTVRAQAVTDLQDLLLGEKVALRGRVIDGRGVPVPGTSVSAYMGNDVDMSQGMVLSLVSSAISVPMAADEAKADERGEFALAALTPGATYELKAKHPGYGFKIQSSIVLSPDVTTGPITIVLQPSATVSGKVTDETGRAVADALVIAIEDFMQGGRAAGRTMKKDYARTKADGTYVLDSLNRGATYAFGVSAEGRAPVFDSTPTTVQVEMTRDFVLEKGGALEGTVTDSVTNAPIENARVVAVVGRMGMGPGGGGFRGRGGRGGAGGDAGTNADMTTSTQVTTTDKLGHFRLDGLKPGPVFLGQVKAAGYADKSATSMMGQTGWGEVKAGETLRVDVQLDSGGTVVGKVTTMRDGASVPVPGAMVSVLPFSFQAAFTGWGTATTAEDGSYRVDGVAVNTEISVSASAPGFVSPNPMDEGSRTKMPEAGGTITKDVVLTSAGSVAGVVRNGKGVPVPGARVRTRSAPEGPGGGRGGMRAMFRQFMPGASNAVVLTDEEGRYRIDSVPSDERMVVEAEADEFVPGESEPFTVKPGEVVAADVTVQGGATLRGRVIGDHGAVLAGARVRVGHLDADVDLATLSGFRADRYLEGRVVSSDRDGWYEVTKIPSGRTLVKVEADGYVTYYRHDLTVQPDQLLENHMITLVKGETISGVVRGEDGKPIVGAAVGVTKAENPTRLGGGGGAPQAGASTGGDGSVEPTMYDQTDAQGKFTVENVPPGSTYTVVVWFAPGYRGFGQGDESAIKRGVGTGSRDTELVLKKSEVGDFGMPGMPRPPGTGGPGMGGAMPPIAPPPPPAPGMAGGVPVPGMGG